MKVLYIGHFEEGSSWSEAASHSVSALQAVGVEVVCRSIKAGAAYTAPPDHILDAMAQSVQGCTHCIQHVLPSAYAYTGGMRNIGYLMAEVTSLRNVGWSYRAGLMDEIWVPCRELANHLSKECNTPINVVPLATNVAKYENRLCEKFPTPTFYSVIDITERKNMNAILMAFHAEFRPEEEVNLIVKISKFGHSPQQCVELAHRANKLVQEKLSMYGGRYHDVVFHAERLSESEMAGFHQSCHCFVLLSRGEAWSYITLDALGYGNDVIVSNCGGPKDYVPLSSGLLVDGYYEPATGNDSIPFYQGGDSRWFEPSISEAMKAMRQKFKEYQPTPFYASLKDADRKRNAAIAAEFSYEKVGKIMGKLLCE